MVGAGLFLYYQSPGEMKDSGFRPDEKPPVPSQPAGDGYVTASISVIGLDGTPIGGMTPIATDTANAFNPPIATGPATDAQGRSQMRIPRDRVSFVRAWDPKGAFFATNFFEIPPSDAGTATPAMTITMAAAVSLQGVLTDTGGDTLPATTVDLMLEHPAKGAWWPARATTDGSGAFFIPSVPPGEYTLSLRSNAGAARIDGLALKPDAAVDLGFIRLAPP